MKVQKLYEYIQKSAEIGDYVQTNIWYGNPQNVEVNTFKIIDKNIQTILQTLNSLDIQ